MGTVKGEWIFNKSLNMAEFDFYIYFTVDGKPYNKIEGYFRDEKYTLWYKNMNTVELLTVYDSIDGWYDEKYRIIYFGENEQTPSSDYNWLIANAHEYACYSIDSETMIGIADAIREKLNTDTKYTPLEMPAAIDAVYEAGKAAGRLEVTESE